MVTLRDFKANDAAVLKQFRYSDASIKEIQDMIHDWNKHNDHGKYFDMLAIMHNNKIVGTISLYQHSDSIISIGPEVFLPFRRQGFGKDAMLIALETAKNKGYKIVCQQIRSNNAASIALHQKLDFETDGYGYKNRKGNEVFIFLKSL